MHCSQAGHPKGQGTVLNTAPGTPGLHPPHSQEKSPELGETGHGDTTAARKGSKEGAAELCLRHGSPELSPTLPWPWVHQEPAPERLNQHQLPSLPKNKPSPSTDRKDAEQVERVERRSLGHTLEYSVYPGATDSESSTHTSHQQGRCDTGAPAFIQRRSNSSWGWTGAG